MLRPLFLTIVIALVLLVSTTLLQRALQPAETLHQVTEALNR